MSKYQAPNLPAIFTNNQGELRQFDKDLVSVLSGHSDNLLGILDRGISIDDNMDMNRFSIVSHVTPHSEFSAAHGLGKIPVGYIVYGQTATGCIYDGSTTNTKTTIYLRSDTSAATFKLIVF